MLRGQLILFIHRAEPKHRRGRTSFICVVMLLEFPMGVYHTSKAKRKQTQQPNKPYSVFLMRIENRSKANTYPNVDKLEIVGNLPLRAASQHTYTYNSTDRIDRIDRSHKIPKPNACHCLTHLPFSCSVARLPLVLAVNYKANLLLKTKSESEKENA